MSKKVEAGEIINPANLWGKPLGNRPAPALKTSKEKETRMLPDDEIDSDVDAELEDEPTDAELVGSAVSDDVEDDSADDDADGFDSETGDDADEEDDEEVDSAVDADEEPSKTTRVVTAMADKKKKSMSDYVRDEIDRRNAAGESLRGVDIVNALTKKGVKVSPAQVSQLLKKAGVSAKGRNPRKTKAAETAEQHRAAVSTRKGVELKRPANKVRPAADTTDSLPVAHLRAAKAFIAACGDSYEEARNVLELHQQLTDVL
jgi:hypothetical protein